LENGIGTPLRQRTDDALVIDSLKRNDLNAAFTCIRSPQYG
jgi:hypothetical protein